MPLGAGATAVTLLGVRKSAAPESSSVDDKLLKCLKVLRGSVANRPGFLNAFENEAHLVSSLHHPNIVRLEQLDRDRDLGLFLVYAYIEGMDLAELIAKTRAAGVQIDWPIVACMGQQIARALECAHTAERGGHFDRDAIIHRDLCPSNILLGRSGGTAYVIDFGFARAIAHATRQASQQFLGRVAYGAPELLRDEPYDCRVDLFSLGVVLFEALTGRRPFTTPVYADQVLVQLAQIKNRQRPPIETLRFEWAPAYGAPVPDGLLRLWRVIECLLEYDPASRLSAAEVGDRLSAIPLPSSVHRDLSDLVRRFQSIERRSIRTHTGEMPSRPPEEEWSATDPVRVAAHLTHTGRFDPVRDGVQVTPEAAERLIAAFAPMRDVSLEDVSLDDMLGVTDPIRPAIAFEAPPHEDEPPTDPDPDVLWALAGASAVEEPLIPTTRPNRPRAHAVETRSTERDEPSGPTMALAIPSAAPAAMSPSSATRIGSWAEPSGATPVSGAISQAESPFTPPPSTRAPTPTEPAPRFAKRHYSLSALDPSERFAVRAKLWIAIAFAIAVLSLSILAAVLLGVIVPSLAARFVWLGSAGLGASFVPASIAIVHLCKSRLSRT